MAKDFDVIIVGGSLAGSTTAFQLASQGVRVALLERENFLRRKVCGEGLSQTGYRLLQNAGLSNVVDRISLQPYDRFLVHDRATEPTTLVSRKGALGYGVPREQFDHAVFQAAVSNPNVTSLQGTFVEEIRQVGDRVTVFTDNGALTAPFVVLAAGSQKGFGIPERKTNSPHIRYGFSFRISGEPRVPFTSVHAFLRDGFQVLCTPVSNDTLTVSVLISKYRVSKSIEALRVEALGFASAFFKEYKICNPVLACGAIGRVRRPASYGRILLAGDVCEQFDPIGGMGMTHAFLCATLASSALRSSISEPTQYLQHFAEYARKRELEVRPLRGFTRLSYSALTKDTWWGTLLRRNAAVGQLVSSTVHGVCASKQCALMLGILAILGTEL